MRQNIYDERNQLIGWLVEDASQIRVFDKNARMVGYYNKSSDITHKNGNYFGKGDQTMRLLN